MAKELNQKMIKIKIIKSLHKDHYYNKRHTPVMHVCKRLSNIPCKYIKKAPKELKKEKIIIVKPTYHGPDVSLNVKKKKEIGHYLSQKKVKKEEMKNLFKSNPYPQIWIPIFSLHQEVRCIPFLRKAVCEVRMDRVF